MCFGCPARGEKHGVWISFLLRSKIKNSVSHYFCQKPIGSLLARQPPMTADFIVSSCETIKIVAAQLFFDLKPIGSPLTRQPPMTADFIVSLCETIKIVAKIFPGENLWTVSSLFPSIRPPVTSLRP